MAKFMVSLTNLVLNEQNIPAPIATMFRNVRKASVDLARHGQFIACIDQLQDAYRRVVCTTPAAARPFLISDDALVKAWLPVWRLLERKLSAHVLPNDRGGIGSPGDVVLAYILRAKANVRRMPADAEPSTQSVSATCETMPPSLSKAESKRYSDQCGYFGRQAKRRLSSTGTHVTEREAVSSLLDTLLPTEVDPSTNRVVQVVKPELQEISRLVDVHALSHARTVGSGTASLRELLAGIKADAALSKEMHDVLVGGGVSVPLPHVNAFLELIVDSTKLSIWRFITAKLTSSTKKRGVAFRTEKKVLAPCTGAKAVKKR